MMDEKMKEKMMDELKELGIEEKMVDEHLMMGAKKMMFGMMKVIWSLKEHGVSDEKAKEILKKMTDRSLEMDMSEKMGEWKEKMAEWKEHKHEHKGGDCKC